jgi:hypothetical protein
MPGNIRLGCVYCDRSDYDGVDQIPSDWEDIQEIQSYEEACRSVEPDDVKRSVFDWQTHLGVCPECRQAGYA